MTLVVLDLAADIALDDDPEHLPFQTVELDVRIEVVERHKPFAAIRVAPILTKPTDVFDLDEDIHAIAATIDWLDDDDAAIREFRFHLIAEHLQGERLLHTTP